jgi:hypothetical protein
VVVEVVERTVLTEPLKQVVVVVLVMQTPQTEPLIQAVAVVVLVELLVARLPAVVAALA